MKYEIKVNKRWKFVDISFSLDYRTRLESPKERVNDKVIKQILQKENFEYPLADKIKGEPLNNENTETLVGVWRYEVIMAQEEEPVKPKVVEPKKKVKAEKLIAEEKDISS